MSNLEFLLLYGVVGLIITMVISNAVHTEMDSGDIIVGTTCWFPLIIVLVVLTVYKTIEKAICGWVGEQMTNLEIALIYFAIGLAFVLVVIELKRYCDIFWITC